MRILCGTMTAISLLAAVSASAEPQRANGRESLQRTSVHSSHHLQREPRDDSGRSPGAEPQRSNSELSDDERRGLRDDLDRANREIYGK